MWARDGGCRVKPGMTIPGLIHNLSADFIDVTQLRIIIIAGPNGAGKTTFAREFLLQEAGCPVFVNADLIAAGLSPFAPERAAIQAGRLMLDALAQHVAKGDSFSFETTLSGLGYARQIPRWRQIGYRVELFFIGLPSANMAVERVAQRVRHGGHDIPEATIRRRFDAGKRLFTTVYQPLVDQWVLYDNAGDEPVVMDRSDKPMISPKDVREPQPDYAELPADIDAYINGSLDALRRAAQRARQVALQTGTDLIIERDGRIVHVNPADEVPSMSQPGQAPKGS
jgi:predicted ABC-type ATPase